MRDATYFRQQTRGPAGRGPERPGYRHDRVFRQNAVELFHFDESVLEQPLATD